jgi:hypothetical protein
MVPNLPSGAGKLRVGLQGRNAPRRRDGAPAHRKKGWLILNIQKIRAELLNPAAYNPRKDLKPGDKEYEKLRRSIEEFGYVEPVIWNKTTGNIVGGHQRLKVLLDLGHALLCTCPVRQNSRSSRDYMYERH